MSKTWILAAAVVAALVVGAAVVVQRGGDDTAVEPAGESVAHVHGLGVNPADGALYAATHFGLFRVHEDGGAARVGQSHQDTMGFTVVGPDHFLASGHPDMDDERLRVPGKPPLLGLIESQDAGETWEPLSLLGDADFHALVAAHGNVYGYDSTSRRFMVSTDGKEWETRSETLMASFAVDPDDAETVVAMTDQGLVQSADGGRSFQPLEGPALVFLGWNSTHGLWGVSPDGETYQRSESGWETRAPLRGPPQALLVTDDELYAAAAVEGSTHIYVSGDGGSNWTVLYREPSGNGAS